MESWLLQVSLDPKAETDLGVGLFVSRKEEEEALAEDVTVEDVLGLQGPYRLKMPQGCLLVSSGCCKRLPQTG